jgi:predicted TPR repeat methyltransferase
MDHNANAVDLFDKNAALYHERYGNLGLYNDTYDLFCSLLTKRNSEVLDVGCGPGNITKYLLGRRPDLRITGIDLAPNMIAIAKENNPGAKFEVMDCRGIIKLSMRFDAIVCGFTIPYLSKEETSQLIFSCATLLERGGLFYFSLIQGRYEDSGFQLASNGVDKSFVHYYNPVTIMRMIKESNLDILQVIDFPWENSSGQTETHLVFLCTVL